MKEKRTLDDLSFHPFTKKCFDDGLRVSRVLEDSTPLKIEPSWKRVPSEEEYYQLTVGSAMATLLSACQQLTDSVLYISSFTPSRRMKQEGVTRQRQVQFCIENYIVRAQSIYDKLLVLIDAVFHLGMADENIGYTLIVTNIHVRMSGIDKKLKAMNKVRNKYLYTRNTIIHHRNYQEDELRKLQGLSMVRNSECGDILNFHLKKLTREYTKKKTDEFNSHIALLFDHLYNVLSDLDKIYQKKEKGIWSFTQGVILARCLDPLSVVHCHT